MVSVEFLVISSSKLKVKLSDTEIIKYSISDIDSERVDKGMRRGLWQLIDIAKERCGFSSAGEKLLVQFYKTESGGELFITKLLQRPQKTEKLLESAANITLLKEQRCIFRFSTADDVISALLMCKDLIQDEISLYYSDDGSYYVTYISRSEQPLAQYVFLEYGEEVAECLDSYIKEHSKTILSGNDFIKLREL